MGDMIQSAQEEVGCAQDTWSPLPTCPILLSPNDLFSSSCLDGESKSRCRLIKPGLLPPQLLKDTQ
jgi:hypothetical protein